MSHRGRRGGRGRPPSTRGGGRPYVVPTRNNNNNIEDSIDTPPRSPSEGSVASHGSTLQDLFGSAVLSPVGSPPLTANTNNGIPPIPVAESPPQMLPPAPVKQQLPTSPPLPKVAVAPKVQTPPPNIGANPKQPIAAPPKAQNPVGNVPDLQGLEDRIMMRMDNFHESLRRIRESNDELRANYELIRNQFRDIDTGLRNHEQALNELFEMRDRQDPPSEGAQSQSAEPRSRPDHRAAASAPANRRPVPAPRSQRVTFDSHQNDDEDALIDMVLEEKHIPPIIETMSGIGGSKTQTMAEWIDNIRVVVTKKRWSDYTARQIFMLRTKGSLYRFLFKENDIDALPLGRILDLIRGRFVTVDQELIDHATIRSIKMENDESVDAYWERFDAIAGRMSKSDFDKMSDFISGLRDDIKEGTVDRHPDSLLAAYNAAQRVESWKNAFYDRSKSSKKSFNSNSNFIPYSKPQSSWQSNRDRTPSKPFANASPSSPKTPAPQSGFQPRSSQSKPFNTPSSSSRVQQGSSVVKKLQFTTPQHNNIEDADIDEFNNVEEEFDVDENEEEPGNELSEE